MEAWCCDTLKENLDFEQCMEHSQAVTKAESWHRCSINDTAVDLVISTSSSQELLPLFNPIPIVKVLLCTTKGAVRPYNVSTPVVILPVLMLCRSHCSTWGQENSMPAGEKVPTRHGGGSIDPNVFGLFRNWWSHQWSKTLVIDKQQNKALTFKGYFFKAVKSYIKLSWNFSSPYK